LGKCWKLLPVTLQNFSFVFFCVLGYQVITTPLPSGGPVLVSMLNILEGFNFTDKDQGKSLTYHYILEVGNQGSTVTFQLTS